MAETKTSWKDGNEYTSRKEKVRHMVTLIFFIDVASFHWIYLEYRKMLSCTVLAHSNGGGGEAVLGAQNFES